MDELVKYFKGIDLPTEPVQINVFTSVSDPVAFIASCQRRHADGDEQGFALLNEYKIALEKLNEQGSIQG